MERLPADKQQGDIWRAIAGGGIDPRGCQLSASSMPGYDWQIVHQPTGYVFYGVEGIGNFSTLRYSFDQNQESVPLQIFYSDWADLIQEIEKWAKEAKAHNVGLQSGEFNPNAAEAAYANSDNRRFTIAEQTEIANQLRMIKESLKQNFKLSAEQIERVEDRLNEAEEASRRLGHKDWILLFSGAVFSLILTDIITPDVAQHIFTAFIHGAGHLFTSGGGPIRGMLHK